MKIVIPTETRSGEKRVAMMPSVVRKFTQLGFDVAVQSGAGREAFASDDAYREAGASVFEEGALTDEIGTADVVASVRPLDYGRASRLRKGWVIPLTLVTLVWTLLLLRLHMTDPIPLNF